MSTTYTPETNARADATTFVPRYARTTRAKKPVRTWMILAPLGALVFAGAAVTMMMNTRPASVAEAPTAATSPAVAAPQADPAPAAMTQAPMPAPVAAATAAPVAAQAQPTQAAPTARAPAPVERAAARDRRAAPKAPADEPVVSTGPQPYAATTSAPQIATGRLNAAPAQAPATTPPAPMISVQPLN